jgi:tetratricopeptide (TPR) repeat protein
LVGQLVPYILGKMAVPQRCIVNHRGGLEIPFEILVGILVRGSRADRFLDIFGTEDPSQDNLSPNPNHILLARLVKAGHLKTIVTTNFDRLVEKALETQGQRPGRDYLVLHDEEGFSRIDWSDSRPRLIKIHGSVQDRKGMAVTFERIERRGLSRASLEVIRNTFSTGQHDDVLVLGYSSSDKFDLTPQIITCSLDSKNVFYVEHSSALRVEPIATKGHGDPFWLFNKGLRISCNTDDLMRCLWGAFFSEQECQRQEHESRWREYVDEWWATVASPLQLLMAGDILKAAARFNDAAQRYEVALVHARKMGDLRLLSDVLRILGEARKGLGQNTLARHLYQESLTIAEGVRDERRISDAKSLLRNMPLDARSQRAVLDLEEARLGARERQDPREEGSILINLGNARMMRKEYDKALICFSQALDRLWGDAEAAAILHNNMGIAYIKLGQHELGEFLYLASIRMSKDLGDRQGEGMTTFLLGESYADRGDYQAALGSYARSLSISETIGDGGMRAQALAGLARARHAVGQRSPSGDFAKAMTALAEAAKQRDLPLNPEIHRLNEEARLSFVGGRYDAGGQQLLQALDRAVELGDLRGQIVTMNNMGIAAVGMNNPSAGIQCHEKALDLSRQIGDRSLEVSTLEHLSRLCFRIGKPLNAIRYYEESVEIARDSGDKEKEVDYLNLLAKAYYNQGESQRAINPLERALQLCRETGNLRLQGVVFNNLGNIHASLEQNDAAVGCFEQALIIFRTLDLPDSVAATQSTLDQARRTML